MSNLLAGFLVCVATLQIHGQAFQNVSATFPIANTVDFLQDSYGFLWLCTDDGLLKYDGYSVMRYAHDPANPHSLSGNNIQSLYEDAKGNLWVGLSNEGLDYFDRNTGQFRPICLAQLGDSCVSHVNVYAISEGPERSVWVGTGQGLYVTLPDCDSVVFQRYAHNSEDVYSISHRLVSKLLYDRHGRMWIGTQDGINLYLGENRFRNHRNDTSFLAGEIEDIVERPSDNVVYLCHRFTPNPVYYWDDRRQQFQPFEVFPQFRHRQFHITFDLEDRIWASARGIGGFMYDGNTGHLEFYDPDKGHFHGYRMYSNVQVRCDRYGNIWTGGAVALKWPNNKKPIWSIPSDDYQVYAVFADDQYVWFSAKKPYRWNRKTLQIEDYWPSGLPVNLRTRDDRSPQLAYIFKYVGYGDKILFTTIRNIFIWDPVTDNYEEIPTARGGPYRDFAFGNRNNIWIAPNQGPPSEMNLTDRKVYIPAEQAIHDIQHLHVVERDKDGYIWFGSTVRGLFRLDESTYEVKQFTPRIKTAGTSISSYNVKDIQQHSDGTLWLGTDLGLNQMDPQTEEFRHYTVKDGLVNDNIASILEDTQGNLWIGTHHGLARFDYASKEFTHFSQDDGLLNTVYSERAAYRDADGWMYFGGNRGVDFFHPDSMGINEIPPDVYIKSIRLHNAPLHHEVAPENLRELTFRHNENFIEIELVALHFASPESNQYAYRLEGARSDTWHDLGTQRVVTLANMSPGSYRLIVRAANADGIWSDDKQLLRIAILPPFWQTWWFFLILAAMSAGSIAAIYRYRVGQIRAQEAIKTSFNKRIAEIELKALQAQMNPHFLFNSLNSVKSLIAKKEDKEASLYLTRFSQLIRQVLNNSRKKFVRLSDELEALRLYLSIESMRFGDKFTYEIIVDENVNADFVDVPPLLLQPYVENAIWHGLLPKDVGERRLTVRLQRDGECIRMIIEDNGIGRENARKLRSNDPKPRESLGMKITSDRITFLREIYGQQAHVQVDDLVNPTGTRVTIHLPIPE